MHSSGSLQPTTSTELTCFPSVGGSLQCPSLGASNCALPSNVPCPKHVREVRRGFHARARGIKGRASVCRASVACRTNRTNFLLFHHLPNLPVTTPLSSVRPQPAVSTPPSGFPFLLAYNSSGVFVSRALHLRPLFLSA